MEVKIQISDEAVKALIENQFEKLPQEDFAVMINAFISDYFAREFRVADIIDKFSRDNEELTALVKSAFETEFAKLTPSSFESMITKQAKDFLEQRTINDILFKKVTVRAGYGNETHIVPSDEFQKLLNEVINSDIMKELINLKAKNLVRDMEDIKLDWQQLVSDIIQGMIQTEIVNNRNMQYEMAENIHKLLNRYPV